MATELKLRKGTTAEHSTFTGAEAEVTFDTDKNTIVGHDGTTAGGYPATEYAAGAFVKANRDSVAWTKTGNGTAETSQELKVYVDGRFVKIPSGTTISMPTLDVGTDYAIWVAPDGSLTADDSFSVPPVAGARRVGGFHYAPGGRATLDLNAGDGGTTAQIMETSFYDLKWRPDVLDPRGLVLVGDGSFGLARTT